jgi:hypothetical protein
MDFIAAGKALALPAAIVFAPYDQSLSQHLRI